MDRYVISVVTYNNGDLLPGLLDDIEAATAHCADIDIELTAKFFDNCSTDRTTEIVRQHGYSETLHVSDRNVGFGAGHNWNFRSGESDVIIICNPDIRFQPTIFDAIRRKLGSDASVGMVLPRLLYPDGSEQHLCKRHPTFFDIFLRRFAPGAVKRMFASRMKRYTMDDHDYSSEFDVPYGSGSFMVIRSGVYAEADGFDERYFMYIEDADITREITNLGYRALYVPDVTVVHHFQKGSYRSKRLAWINIVSVMKYLLKWNVGYKRRTRRRTSPSAASGRLPRGH